MSTTKNKVKFNIKNCYYAKKTETGFSAPVALPGAVSLTLEQQGELEAFYADGVKYYVSSSNGGYEGDLEIALITDEFRKDILGEIEDANGVLIENADAETSEFAFGFQIDGDQIPTLFWFYNCTATRPSISSQTNEATKKPQTDSVTLSCSADDKGIVRAKTTPASYATVAATWFTEVYEVQESEG